MRAVTIFFLLILPYIFKCQCIINAAMGVYTACNNGQGCTSGCNLTAYSAYGPMCNGTSVSGNCFGSTSAGQQNMATSYVLPAGCTAVVNAEFKKRGGACTNSGMDGGDLIGINSNGASGTNAGTCGGGATASGVVAGGCQGSANADVTVTRTQTGGSLTLWGAANRSDEIITFTITLTGSCGTSCAGVLPIEVINYWTEKSDLGVEIKWLLATQRNVNYFTIEKSIDGVNYKLIGTQPAGHQSNGEKIQYAFLDTEYIPGLYYYRLNNVDYDGSKGDYKILVVNNAIDGLNIWVENNQAKSTIHLSENLKRAKLQLVSVAGTLIKTFSDNEISTGLLLIDKEQIAKGLYLLKSVSGEYILNPKVVVY